MAATSEPLSQLSTPRIFHSQGFENPRAPTATAAACRCDKTTKTTCVKRSRNIPNPNCLKRGGRNPCPCPPPSAPQTQYPNKNEQKLRETNYETLDSLSCGVLIWLYVEETTVASGQDHWARAGRGGLVGTSTSKHAKNLHFVGQHGRDRHLLRIYMKTWTYLTLTKKSLVQTSNTFAKKLILAQHHDC